MRDVLDRRRVLVGVAVATLLGLLARLYALGFRMMHWDEGRVGYRTLQYAATGEWSYNPFVHGPFLFHVDAFLFQAAGANDFIARLPVALVGALLPAGAWLYRERLRDVEVVALAAILATNAAVLYYSRFMRNEVLVAAFAFLAVGFAIRVLDTGRRRYLYAAVAMLGLAFTTKENAVMYVGIWVGALALLVDHRLFTARRRGEGLRTAVERLGGVALTRLRTWAIPLVLAGVEFLVIVSVFYAPRPEFYRMFSAPAMVPGVLEEATLGSWNAFMNTWGSGSHQQHPYLPFLEDYLRTMWAAALVPLVAGIVGFLADRYTGEGLTDVVAFASYWAGASLLLYPLATDISAPWSTVHTVVPLAIPAAVGIRLLVDRFRKAIAVDDRVGTGLAAVLALALILQAGVATVSLVYLQPQDNTALTQFGQPSDNMKPALATIDDVAAQHTGGPDVLFFGLKFAPPGAGGPLYFDRLPLPWYMRSMGIETTGEADLEALEGEKPPVVIVPGDASYISGYTETDAKPYLDGYTRLGAYAVTLKIPGNVVYAVVYVDNDALADARAADHTRVGVGTPARVPVEHRN
ncbi:MAG: flippase activity-associated protein Agl23 [Halobacteriaceae archaeon]